MPTQKDEAWVRAMQELRRSSASGRHRNLKKYTRKVKHAKRGEDR